MRIRASRGPLAAALAVALASSVSAQNPPASPAAQAPVRLTIDDAVKLALERNQAMRAQRLTISESLADQITAGLKPNPALSLGIDGLTAVSPIQPVYTAGLDYTFERGGKRQKRITAAQESTSVTSQDILDAERQLRYQTQQAYIAVQLAKSTLDLAQQNRASFSNTVETSRARVTAGDLSEGDFLMISLQTLQFEQDVTSAELSLIQGKASLRQLVGYESVPEDFDVVGDLAHLRVSVTLDALKQAALEARPDLLAAQSGVKFAQAQADLEIGNRAQDVDGSLIYSRNNYGPGSAFGAGVTFGLAFNNRNQGNIAHTRIAIQQAQETAAAARATVLTDVVSAFSQYETNDKVAALYESGYLDQARESLDIARYVFQRGAGSLLSLLDAERTYRATQLAYRQALAAYLSSVFQLNFVVGRQVVP